VYGDGRVPRWGPSQIRRILTEPAYKGETVLWRYKSQGRNKNHIMRPEHEWIRLPGITPAIVAPAVWEVAQQRLRETNAATTRNERRQYLLRGLIRCAVCGLPMYSSVERGATRTYRCSSRDRPSGRCGSKRVPADIVERELWQELKAFFSDPERVRA